LTDNVDVADLNTNADDIDAAVGMTICTSTTRPSSPWDGQSIHETDTDNSFVWNGTAWKTAGGGGSGAGGAILLNGNEITSNYTFPSDTNGVSAGPVTIASGVTVTVGATSAWSIV
jgi:hypothetical protein